jgi:hypothetical protein
MNLFQGKDRRLPAFNHIDYQKPSHFPYNAPGLSAP